MAREELDIQYNLVDNYSNQVDRLINKTREFTNQVKQAQSATGRGLSLAGGVVGGAAAGGITAGASNMFGGIAKTLGLVTAGLLTYQFVIKRVSAAYRSLASDVFRIRYAIERLTGAIEAAAARIRGAATPAGQRSQPLGLPMSGHETVNFARQGIWTREKVEVKAKKATNVPFTVVGGGKVEEQLAAAGGPGFPSSEWFSSIFKRMIGRIGGFFGSEGPLMAGLSKIGTTIGSMFARLGAAIGPVVASFGTFLIKAAPVAILIAWLTMAVVALAVAAKTAVTAVNYMVNKFVEMSAKGVETFGNFQSIQIAMEGFTGSKSQAADLMKFVKNFAAKSPINFEDLARIIPELMGANVDIKRALPLISKIAAAQPANRRSEMVQMLTNALVRAKSGSYGESLETLGIAGVNRADLAKGGLAFNKNRSPNFQGATDEWEKFLSALEKGTGRFDNVAKLMQNSFEVAMSNLGDKWSQLWATIGAKLAPIIQGLADKLSNLFSFLMDKDILGGIGVGLTQVFNDIVNAMGGMDGLVDIAFWIVAAFQELPAILKSVFDSVSQVYRAILGFGSAIWTFLGPVIIGVFDLVAGAVLTLYKVFQFAIMGIMAILRGVMWALDALPGIDLQNELKALDTAQEDTAGSVFDLRGYAALPSLGANPMEAALGALGVFAPDLPDIVGNIKGNHDRLKQDYKGYKPSEDATAAAVGGNAEEKKQTSVLRKIEENTAPLEDFKKYALGGGDLGRIGITPVEMYGMRRNVSISPSSSISSKYARMMDELLAEYTQQLHAQEAF